MIVTVTLNPAVDLTTFVDHLDVGAVNRYREPELDPAGKGINVSRMAHRLGWPTIAFGFLAGEIGNIVPRALDTEGVPYHFVPVPGQTRLDVTIFDQSSRQSTDLYGRGIAAGPFCIKPNRDEAERRLGRALPDLNAVMQGAREPAQRGIDVVVISMGADGAVCVNGGKVWRAIPPKVERKSTVGSGDSLVAGLAVALARGEPIVEGLPLGTAAGAATAMTPSTALGAAAQVQALLPRVQIEELAGRVARAA